MHFIQKNILDKLRITEDTSYTKLAPAGIESGHFRYHLNMLMKDKYIEQVKRGTYRLTLKGQAFVDTLSQDTVNPHKMPKVITYTLLESTEAVLLQEKAKEPYMGLLNFIGGKMHQGETAKEASMREVFEKTGVAIKPPHYVGSAEIVIKKDKQVLSHVIALLFRAQVGPGDFASSDLVSIAPSAIGSQPDSYAPDFLELYDYIKNSSDTSGLLTLHIDL